MNDNQLLRYSRHIMLDEIGIEGQQRLLDSTALIIGAGGLGSPAAMYLAASGVGRLIVVDHDTVDLTNLQRQIAHTHARVGQLKVESARDSMRALNPEVRVEIHAQRADAALLDTLVPQADVVLDCTDHFAIRHTINAACVRHRTALIEGSAIGFTGQVARFDLHLPESPCYACLFPPSQEAPEVACATMGVFSPLVGVVGSLQAAEALKKLTIFSQQSHSKLLLVNLADSEYSQIAYTRDSQCPVCGPKINCSESSR